MRRIIIDADPGQDDAIALLLALASSEFEVLGITTVAGNVSLIHTEANARRICELAGRTDLPVFMGCPRPLFRTMVDAAHVHGKTGLDGCGLPKPTMPSQKSHAVQWLIQTLSQAPPKSVTLCLLGPMTNLASALIQAPQVHDAIEEVVAMGGAIHRGGNVTPVAEFNIYADPHAVDIVLRSGLALTLMPLDVTHQALITPSILARFAALSPPIGEACRGMLDFYFRPNEARYGEFGNPLHDLCVIAYLIAPHLFSGKKISVAIETHSPLTLGMTVGDWWNSTSLPANTIVMNRIDTAAFFELIFSRLGNYGK